MIGAKIITYFVSSKQISKFRTYILIKEKFDSKIKSNSIAISEIAQLLGTSKDAVRKHILQLHKAGLLEKGGNGWYHIVGNRRFSDKFSEDLSLRGYDFTDLSVLKDIKKFRTLLYAIEYQIASFVYRKQTCVNDAEIVATKTKNKRNRIENARLQKEYNEIKEKDPASSISQLQLKTFDVPVARYEVSNSFISLTTNRSHAVIAKHRIRAKEYGFVSYKRTFDVLYCTKEFMSKTNFCVTPNTPIFKFHNNKINNFDKLNKRVKADVSLREEAGLTNAFPLKDNQGKVCSIVSEVIPVITFNITSNKIRPYLTPLEKQVLKESRMRINSMKN